MRHRVSRHCIAAVLLLACTIPGVGQNTEFLEHVQHTTREGRSLIVVTTRGQRVRITPYGNYIIRIQAVRDGEEFLADGYYEMVESHDWGGTLIVSSGEEYMTVQSQSPDGLALRIQRDSLQIEFLTGNRRSMLRESTGIWWEGNAIHATFQYDPAEHVTGLGHSYYGRSESIDLRNQVARRNYGAQHGQQSPLIVPFYLSSKGYGVFLNSMCENSFNFGKDGTYELTLVGHGFPCRMDYFVILGPEFSQILNRYTKLTGRPRLPPKAAFGLGLSDKGNDEHSSSPSDEQWWKDKVKAHRLAGFPIDHLINDNRWRAGGGKRCESYFAWDNGRFPDPAEYKRWLDSTGLITTLDFNRCIASRSEGWEDSFNLPETGTIEFGDSAPDLTRREVRRWWWRLFWEKSLNPALRFPGDALWIDEFDELGAAPDSMILGNGRPWSEMKNYWFFLIAKALVQEGWDSSARSDRRPFVWVRGMTAGAQRYATLWSGDIQPNYSEMAGQIRSMQLAGLSGFPYWGHDAGGFYDGNAGNGPDDALYRKWSMAMGSFSPFWKPHGPGESRWPLDRSPSAQQDAMTYSRLRYQLMPYTYTAAFLASRTGIPIARAMVIDHQLDSLAWKFDLQYMWGPDILVAPDCSTGDSVTIWLPAGRWYNFWNDQQLEGTQVITAVDTAGRIPLFVKAGAIITMAPYALSTAMIPNDTMTVHIYTGVNGHFTLYEDDGRSESYRARHQYRTTHIDYTSSRMRVMISPATGNFAGAPSQRTYRVDFHGLPGPICLEVDGSNVGSGSTRGSTGEDTLHWDKKTQCLSLYLHQRPIADGITIKKTSCGEHQ